MPQGADKLWIRCQANRLSGSLSPWLPKLTALRSVNLAVNAVGQRWRSIRCFSAWAGPPTDAGGCFQLTGTLPSLGNLTQLRAFQVGRRPGAGAMSSQHAALRMLTDRPGCSWTTTS